MWWIWIIYIIFSTFMSNWTLNSPKKSDEEVPVYWILATLNMIPEIEAAILTPSGELTRKEKLACWGWTSRKMENLGPWWHCWVTGLPNSENLMGFLKCEVIHFSYYLCHFELYSVTNSQNIPTNTVTENQFPSTLLPLLWMLSCSYSHACSITSFRSLLRCYFFREP